MEKKEIANGPIGQIGNFKVDFESGKLVAQVEISAPAAGFTMSVKAEQDAKPVAIKSLEWLKGKIPGTLDDAIIDLAIKGVEAL